MYVFILHPKEVLDKLSGLRLLLKTQGAFF
jgi:hypothetical protein